MLAKLRRLTGHEALNTAHALGCEVRCYGYTASDLVEQADGSYTTQVYWEEPCSLSPEEALEVLEIDPSLLYLDMRVEEEVYA